jgi:hypothetical protein
MLLKQWAEKVQAEHLKEGKADNVWERSSEKAPATEEGASDVFSNVMSSVASPRPEKEPAEPETGVIGDRKAAVEYTVEELFRRMRRIEKLTRMIRTDGEGPTGGYVPPRVRAERGGAALSGAGGSAASDFGRSQKYAKVAPLSLH